MAQPLSVYEGLSAINEAMVRWEIKPGEKVSPLVPDRLFLEEVAVIAGHYGLSIEFLEHVSLAFGQSDLIKTKMRELKTLKENSLQSIIGFGLEETLTMLSAGRQEDVHSVEMALNQLIQNPAQLGQLMIDHLRQRFPAVDFSQVNPAGEIRSSLLARALPIEEESDMTNGT